MPKKINKKKEVKYKSNKESLINVNNVNYFFGGAIIVLIIICACVGIYKYSKDKYHVHASNPIISFSYNEKIENKGYNVFQLDKLQNERKYLTYDNPSGEHDQIRLSDERYLDLNEELYELGVADTDKIQIHVEGSDPEWSIEAKLQNGEEVYFSSDGINDIDKTKLAEIIKKYYKRDVLYK